MLITIESYFEQTTANTAKLDPNIPSPIGDESTDFLGQYVAYLVPGIDLESSLRDCSDFKRFAKHFEGRYEN